MQRNRMLVFGMIAVTAVAVTKTALLNTYVGGLGESGASTPTLAFGALWLVTAALAGLIYLVVKRATEARRRLHISDQLKQDPGKENLIEVHAREWGLTKAETDVAIMVVKGFSNAEIAAMRGSALQTVKSQLSAIYQKSGLEGRYQLLAYITDEVCEATRSAGLSGCPTNANACAKSTQRAGSRLVVINDADMHRGVTATSAGNRREMQQ